MTTYYAIDIKGRKNLLAQEIPSAVGMVGVFVPELGGEYDYSSFEFKARVSRGEFRPASIVRSN